MKAGAAGDSTTAGSDFWSVFCSFSFSAGVSAPVTFGTADVVTLASEAFSSATIIAACGGSKPWLAGVEEVTTSMTTAGKASLSATAGRAAWLSSFVTEAAIGCETVPGSVVAAGVSAPLLPTRAAQDALQTPSPPTTVFAVTASSSGGDDAFTLAAGPFEADHGVLLLGLTAVASGPRGTLHGASLVAVGAAAVDGAIGWVDLEAVGAIAADGAMG